jgi:hypothetical protein
VRQLLDRSTGRTHTSSTENKQQAHWVQGREWTAGVKESQPHRPFFVFETFIFIFYYDFFQCIVRGGALIRWVSADGR